MHERLFNHPAAVTPSTQPYPSIVQTNSSVYVQFLLRCCRGWEKNSTSSMMTKSYKLYQSMSTESWETTFMHNSDAYKET